MDDEGQLHELLRVTDQFTEELFDHVLDLGGLMFVNHLSRLVVDPERFRSDEDEIMGRSGCGRRLREDV